MNLSLIGMQWGDEGKGKIIDFISNYSNFNIRYNGGHNAGHVIYKKKIKKIIKIIPSGLFKKYCLCLLSDNIYLLINNFLNELKNKKKIFISENIFLVNLIDEFLDYLIDKIIKIGSTYSGISIFVLRKIIKCTFNIRDTFKIIFINFIKKTVFFYNVFFIFFNIKIKILIYNFYLLFKCEVKLLKKIIIYNNVILNLKSKKIFESSQGVMLDFNKGTFPFVTNSNIINKSIYINSGFYLDKMKFIGIVKSYSTRVGNGYFNSIFKNKKNKFFSIINKEFGTNSLRLRKSGWLDILSLIKMIKINNISNLILTKLDALICVKYLKFLINYKIKKKYYNYQNIYKKCFLYLFSWKKINIIYKKNDKFFHFFIRYLEKILNTPICLISIGKNEKDLIFL